MDSPLAKKKQLVDALALALGSSNNLNHILEDLAEAGEIGLAIRNNLSLENALKPDCNRLIGLCKSSYGYAGLSILHEVLHAELSLKATWSALEQALIAYRSTVEPPVSPSAQPAAASVYISYAWGDPSPEGVRRGLLVDQLYEAIKTAGLSVRIDREEVKPGDRISSFMKAIAKGDVVIIILSQKYLESEFCVYELNGIWRENSRDPDRFLRRVIPLTLPDANLKTTEDIFLKIKYWKQRWQGLEGVMAQNIDVVDRELHSKCKDIQEFSQQIGDILALLTDKCEPRDFDRQAQEGFREVISQIRAVRQG